MKKIMVLLVALLAMFTFSSCSTLNTVENDEDVYVIEELQETADEYILSFRDSDKRISVNKSKELKPGMIVCVKQTDDEVKIEILNTHEKTRVCDILGFFWGMFCGWGLYICVSSLRKR